MEGACTVGKKEKHVVLQGELVTWMAKKGAKKNDGECALKAGVAVAATASGFSLGPDSVGNTVEFVCPADQSAKWVAAIQGVLATTGEASSDSALLQQGWLVREKKKFFFQLRGGYLSWYNKEPNASIPHNKNFVKEITLNGCTVAQAANAGIDLVKTTKTEKKTESKTYSFTANDDADAKQWVASLLLGIGAAEEAGLGTGERSRASVGARMKKGVAQKIATSKGGKSAAKKVLNAEVMGLLNALKITIECYAGKERAEEMENNMIRIITKLYFAVDTKQVPIQELLPADKYLREALKKLSLVWGGRFRTALTRSQPEKEKEALEVVSRNMTKIEEILIKSLSNVLQPKNIALIRSTLAFLKDHKYLTFVVEDNRLEGPRTDLEAAIDQYNAVELEVSAFQ